MSEQSQPAPELSPSGSSSPSPSVGPSSVPASWPAVFGHGISAALATFTVVKVLGWLPTCLALIRLPSGGVSHDPWAWAPLVLDLAAVVAVAAPVSFRSLLDLARGLAANVRGKS